MVEALWKTRNKNKHGTNPKERKDTEKDRLSPQIKKAYREQYTSMLPQFRRQYIGIKLATRLAYRSQQNKILLGGERISIEAKTTREQFLLNRKPKLERYYNLRRNNSVAKIEHRSPTPKRKQGPQTLVSRYIDIYDNTPMDLGHEWRRQMKERPVHPAIPEGDKEGDSGRGGKETEKKKKYKQD